MSKNKKPRNKKYNPAVKLSAYVHQRAQRVYCYDAKCYAEMQYNGGPLNQPLPLHVKKKIMYSVADAKHTWSIMLLVFQTDGIKQWYDKWIIDTLPPESSNNLAGILNDDLIKKVNQCNPKHLASWAWFASPLVNADLIAMEKEIVDRFILDGCYDKELCNRVDDQRVLAEKLERSIYG